VRLSSRDNLRELWEDHLATRFPAELYQSPGGVEMVSVDSAIAGCASSVVETGRLSDPSHAAALDGCLDDLRTVAPLLRSAEAMRYCERLVSLARAIRECVADA
jgi:hypothetical protein